MFRETQLNFELTASAAHCRGNCIIGNQSPVLGFGLLSEDHASAPGNCIIGNQSPVLGFGLLSEDHASAEVDRRLQAFLGSSR
jgi:hypothetical protein